MRTLLPVLLALTLAAAGCLSAPSGTLEPSSNGAVAEPPQAPGPAEGEGHDHRTHSHAGGFEWATPDAALIRPGVQVVSETGQCTSNFLFVGADGASLYLGLAAHCVEGLELGAPLDIADGAASGTLAYSSWLTMGEVGEKDADALEHNDFALVLVAAEDRAKAHPSMLHFGGPIELGASDAIATGDKVLTYGHSGLRPHAEPLQWHEGYVVETSAWSTTVYTLTPGIPGDSGSGVLDADGRALGVLVTLTITPLAGSNGVTHLDRALAYAEEHAGLAVTLAASPLVDAGMLPSP